MNKKKTTENQRIQGSNIHSTVGEWVLTAHQHKKAI